MIVVPAATAAFLVHRESGREGLRDLVRTLFRFPPATAAVTVVPAVHVLPLAVDDGRNAESVVVVKQGPRPGAAHVARRAATVFPVYWAGAIPEELGWTAYATAPLQRRFGVAGAGAIIGAVWAAWHVIPYRSMGKSGAWIALQSTATVATRVIMGHVFAATRGALGPAVLLHAASNTMVDALPGATSTRRTAIVAGLTTAVAAVLSFRGRHRVSLRR
ncbi:CPBP family intramembrane glutamic endopeptidase [Corynebacterium sp. NPDC060344]|uniref:CPBP family intramembrane glutamic endopeptidase n=1 Tax=Corynebacterium sp. NPDC060344 TaxID=3347101 RepID=UPI003661D536